MGARRETIQAQARSGMFRLCRDHPASGALLAGVAGEAQGTESRRLFPNGLLSSLVVVHRFFALAKLRLLFEQSFRAGLIRIQIRWQLRISMGANRACSRNASYRKVALSTLRGDADQRAAALFVPNNGPRVQLRATLATPGSAMGCGLNSLDAAAAARAAARI